MEESATEAPCPSGSAGSGGAHRDTGRHSGRRGTKRPEPGGEATARSARTLTTRVVKQPGRLRGLRSSRRSRVSCRGPGRLRHLAARWQGPGRPRRLGPV